MTTPAPRPPSTLRYFDCRLPPEMVARLAQMSLDNEIENVARQYGANRKARRIKDAVARRKPRKSR